MNETNNIQLVKQAYEKFGNKDIEGLLDHLSNDISWKTPKIEGADFTGERTGREAVGEFFKQVYESEDFSKFEPTDFIAQEDKVIVLGSSAATVKSTGRSAESDWVHVFTFSDGKVTGFQEYFDSAAFEHAYQKATTA